MRRALFRLLNHQLFSKLIPSMAGLQSAREMAEVRTRSVNGYCGLIPQMAIFTVIHNAIMMEAGNHWLTAANRPWEPMIKECFNRGWIAACRCDKFIEKPKGLDWINRTWRLVHRSYLHLHSLQPRWVITLYLGGSRRELKVQGYR